MFSRNYTKVFPRSFPKYFFRKVLKNPFWDFFQNFFRISSNIHPKNFLRNDFYWRFHQKLPRISFWNSCCSWVFFRIFGTSSEISANDFISSFFLEILRKVAIQILQDYFECSSRGVFKNSLINSFSDYCRKCYKNLF